MFKTILSIPLFLYMLGAFNLLMYSSQEDPLLLLNKVMIDFDLPSGSHVAITISALFILTGIFFLYIEILKATRSSVFAVVDHGLSMLVFVAFLVEFLINEKVGNSTFLILTVLAFIDVVAGFTVTISAARRDIALA